MTRLLLWALFWCAAAVFVVGASMLLAYPWGAR